jgi:hypothetical protein
VCEDYDSEDPTCIDDHPFTIPSGGGIDNAEVTVRIDWATTDSDWDLRIFRDSNGDGSSVGETEEVASSGQGFTTFEEATFAEPFAPDGKYVARVINYAASEPYEGTISFAGPNPPQGPGAPEAWNLTCERGGDVVASVQVVVARGEEENLDLTSACTRSGEPQPPERCANVLNGSGKRDRLNGTDASDLLRGRGGNDRLRGEGGDDCMFGGGGRDRLDGGAGRDEIAGGAGNDRIDSRDGEADRVRCGSGRDRVKSDPEDDLSRC